MTHQQPSQSRLGKALKSTVAMVGSCAMLAGMLHLGAAPSAYAQENDYKLYPTPHSISYPDGNIALGGTAKVVAEPGIDQETQSRLQEVLDLAGISKETSDTVPTSGTNPSILLGIYDSKGTVDTYVKKLLANQSISYDDQLFTKTDAYFATARPQSGNKPAEIIVLGASTDAVYYGLTSVYQMVQQNTKSLKAFALQDWADVITRGFIEGYYGNPWSVQDRVNLMKWGGYYKLNAYVYAPKDDPKHNREWRELYTEQELREKVEPLALAGNQSKVRFVYALHPFMNSPMRFDSNYEQDLNILKAKYLQVIDHGVRQISLLADDARDVGAANYQRLLNDLTAWVHELQQMRGEDGQLKYPGLKDTIPFCPPNYYGSGEAWYRNVPSNIQVINTGGQVWGKVSASFLNRFRNNSGVTPFMWINWPCSDNDKDALHMANYENFLGTDVTPGSVQGVVLNPMQQSEPSKAAIFLNADFTWNLWKSQEHSDQAWLDSWSYVDHNSPIPTDSSRALHELSEHMRRMYGGGATWEARESAAMKPTLVDFMNKLRNRNVTKEDTAAMRDFYTQLKNAAQTYENNPGNADMLRQITPWIGAWKDLTTAALAYLDAADALIDNNKETLIAKYDEGKKALKAYNDDHGFNYIDHNEYAKVGKAFVSPLVAMIDDYLLEDVTLAKDPTASVRRYITSRTDAPASGDPRDVLDNDDTSGVIYKTPNTVTEGTYVGVVDTQSFTLERATFVLGGGKNFIDQAKLQVYTGEEWVDVEGQDNLTGSLIDIRDLHIENVRGIRLIATRDNTRDAWLTVYEISVNKVDPEYVVSLSNNLAIYKGKLGVVIDGDSKGTPLWVKGRPNSNIPANGAVTVTFKDPKAIKAAAFSQGYNGYTPDNDKISRGALEYLSVDAAGQTGAWIKLADVNNNTDQTFTFDTVRAKAIRVRATQASNYWWKINELSVTQGEESDIVEPEQIVVLSSDIIATSYGGQPEVVVDGQLHGTPLWVTSSAGDFLPAGASVSVVYGTPKRIDQVTFTQGYKNETQGGDVLAAGVLEYRNEQGDWVALGNLNSDHEQTISFEPVVAKAVRVVNKQRTEKWWQVNEISVREAAENGEGETEPEPTVSPEMTVRDAEQQTVSQVQQGASITVSVSGFAPGHRVRFELHSDPVILGTVEANERGEASLTATIASDTTPGEHEVVAVDDADPAISVRMPLTVLAAESTDETTPTDGNGEDTSGDVTTPGTGDSDNSDADSGNADNGDESAQPENPETEPSNPETGEGDSDSDKPNTDKPDSETEVKDSDKENQKGDASGKNAAVKKPSADGAQDPKGKLLAATGANSLWALGMLSVAAIVATGAFIFRKIRD